MIVYKVIRNFSNGGLLYLPPFLFGIIAPIIILNYQSSEHAMVEFYAATFGLGMVTSGITNSLQYVVSKFSDGEVVDKFIRTYILSRLALILIILPFENISFTFYGMEYTYLFFIVIIFASFPGWSYLYLKGFTRLPIFMVWVENLLKVCLLYFLCVYDISVWWFLMIPASINTLVSLPLLTLKTYNYMRPRQFFNIFGLFVSNGVLFSLSWLTFMSMLIGMSSSSVLVVFFERILRILERASSILSTLILRANTKLSLSDKFKLNLLSNIKTMWPYAICATIAFYFFVDELVAFFVICIFNITLGQLVQQLLRPNKIYNFGGMIQAVILLIPVLINPQLDEKTVIFLFVIGGLVNFIIRVLSVTGPINSGKL
ncbi:hypothetical protein [Vibrio cyclitrophicus]|uniref:hypothetical protein n=1 Tax=Vibrio sp. R78045 TaxID=3093868 RepID=UPI00354CA4EC